MIVGILRGTSARITTLPPTPPRPRPSRMGTSLNPLAHNLRLGGVFGPLRCYSRFMGLWTTQRGLWTIVELDLRKAATLGY